MRFGLVLSIAFLMLFVVGQNYGSGIAMIDSSSEATFCDTAPANFFCLDFEDGLDDCTDANHRFPADSVEATPECAHTGTVIAGSASGLFDSAAVGGASRADWNDNDDFTESCNTTRCTVNFRYRFTNDSDSSSINGPMILKDNAGSLVIQIVFQGSTNSMFCGVSGSNSSGIVISDDTTYFISGSYEFSSGDGSLDISTIGYGLTDVGTTTCSGGSPLRSRADRIRLGSSNGADEFIDDLYIFEG